MWPTGHKGAAKWRFLSGSPPQGAASSQHELLEDGSGVACIVCAVRSMISIFLFAFVFIFLFRNQTPP